MSTLTKQPAIPAARRSRPPAKPWFAGDVASIESLLRAARTDERPDGDCVQAVQFIEEIQDNDKLSGAAKNRLSEAVVIAVQIVRGWYVPMGMPEPEPQAAAEPAADQDPAPAAAPAAPAVPATPVPAESNSAAPAVRVEPTADELIVEELRAAVRSGPPDGDCVQAIRLIEQVQSLDVPPSAKNRQTVAILAAVWEVRGWPS